MSNTILSRRDFLASAGASLGISVLAACDADTSAQSRESDLIRRLRANAKPRGTSAMGAIDVPNNVSAKHSFTIGKDDGEPMKISGTVYQKDGRIPAPNALIYFYHTDKFGIYGRGAEHQHGRYRAWLLTDERGRYEFSTILPASYPDSTQSKHIHLTVTTVETGEDWIDSILFEGDPYITKRERELSGRRGGFNPIIRLTKDANGILNGVRDIQLFG